MPFAFKRRRSGLGNELLPWAKAIITSQELGIPLLTPAWGLHARGYRHYFRTSRLDWVARAAAYYGLPRIDFTQHDYEATGVTDFDVAIRIWAERRALHRRHAYIIVHDGMWPGFFALRRARSHVMSLIYRTRHLTDNLYQIHGQLPADPFVVAVNVRLGDFQPPVSLDQYRDRWNTRLEMGWYASVCRVLKEALGPRVVFHLVSDGTEEELQPFIEEFAPIRMLTRTNVFSDLVSMIDAEVVVCSISAFAMWAVFLGRGLYFWYLPNLQNTGGLLTLWGNQVPSASAQPADDLLPRGVPVGPDGAVPGWAIEYLRHRIRLTSPVRDIVMGGGVPAGDPWSRRGPV